MVINITYLIIILIILFLFFGYNYNEPYLKVVGFTLMFFIGVSLINGIDYTVGTSILTINSTLTQEQDITYNYSNVLLGVIVCFASVGGFTVSLANARGKK